MREWFRKLVDRIRRALVYSLGGMMLDDAILQAARKQAFVATPRNVETLTVIRRFTDGFPGDDRKILMGEIAGEIGARIVENGFAEINEEPVAGGDTIIRAKVSVVDPR